MGLPELLALSAEELATGYGARRFNPVEVIEQLAQYVPTANPRINAFLSIKFDEARETATLSAERWAKGVPLGRLDGIPISIKDHLLVRGWISRSGATTSDATSAAAEDSPSAARLRESGAILFGHTTMPEYGWKPTGDSKLTG